MASAPREDPVSSQRLKSLIREMQRRLGERNTSPEIASSMSPLYPSSLNCIQTSGKTPILQLPDELLLMTRPFLDKQALSNSSRVCKRLHTVVGMRVVSTAWKSLANDPLAGETMELLRRLESQDSDLLLVKGFQQYIPKTDQRKTLKTLLASKKKNSKLCTTLLRTDMEARRPEDAQFLLENGAEREPWNRWEEYNESQRKQRRTKQFDSRQAKVQKAAAARTA